MLKIKKNIFSERGCVDEDVLTAMASLGCFKDRDKLVNELLSPVHNTGTGAFINDVIQLGRGNDLTLH